MVRRHPRTAAERHNRSNRRRVHRIDSRVAVVVDIVAVAIGPVSDETRGGQPPVIPCWGHVSLAPPSLCWANVGPMVVAFFCWIPD